MIRTTLVPVLSSLVGAEGDAGVVAGEVALGAELDASLAEEATEADVIAAGESEFGPSAWPNFQDPSDPPGPEWEWRGNDEPGGARGSWYNPGTRESLHPDLDHPEPIGPHYDWKSPCGSYRVFEDGRVDPK